MQEVVSDIWREVEFHIDGGHIEIYAEHLLELVCTYSP